MQSKGVKSVYILNDKEAYGLGVAKNFQGAAKALGMKIKGFAAYDPKAANFQAMFTKIKATDPDAIFIGGLIDENSGQLINDKVSILGPNTDRIRARASCCSCRTASRPTPSSSGRRAGRRTRRAPS